MHLHTWPLLLRCLHFCTCAHALYRLLEFSRNCLVWSSLMSTRQSIAERACVFVRAYILYSFFFLFPLFIPPLVLSCVLFSFALSVPRSSTLTSRWVDMMVGSNSGTSAPAALFCALSTFPFLKKEIVLHESLLEDRTSEFRDHVGNPDLCIHC